MSARSVLALFALVALSLATADRSRGDDSLARKWQDRLDKEPRFEFNHDANVFSSIKDYSCDCQLHLICGPGKTLDWSLAFVKNGKRILSLDAHEYTVFCNQLRGFEAAKRPEEDILYFAHFSPADCGCKVAAYDMSNGKQLWATDLKGVGDFDHSLWGNSVNIHLDEGVVYIAGEESSGKYLEVLDRRTGKTIAHRIFPKSNKDKKSGGSRAAKGEGSQ